MDLRRQLVAWLGALLLGLMAVTVAISLVYLRGEVAQEVRASEQLALALLEAGRVDKTTDGTESRRRLAAILARGDLRHITISLETDRRSAAPPGFGAHLAGLLGVAGSEGELVRLGGQLVRIAPNPASEIEERLNDAVRLWSTLLFFSGATLLVAWWAVQRALAPVRALEAGLQRLAEGQQDARLPHFKLREFTRVAAAIDRLAAALSDSQLARRRLAHQLIRVQEDERRTLAMELHDDMGQTLTAISVTAAYLGRHADHLDSGRIHECAQDLRRDVRSCGEQMRAMLSRLRPHGLEGPGLAPALRELLRNWQQRASSIEFTVCIAAELPPLGKEHSLVLYRVVQEGLTNLVRHSQALHCRVDVAVDDGVVIVCIEDDGRGMAAKEGSHGCGLTGMRERLCMVGGQLQIGAGGQGGVRLLASVPASASEQWKEAA